FLLRGRGGAVVRRLGTDLGAMPFTSVNAHNLWWLLGRWRPAQPPLLGAITRQALGFGLFVVLDGLLLWHVRRRLADDTDRAAHRAGIMVLGAAAATTFFFVATHMHENHMFLAVPLL